MCDALEMTLLNQKKEDFYQDSHVPGECVPVML